MKTKSVKWGIMAMALCPAKADCRVGIYIEGYKEGCRQSIEWFGSIDWSDRGTETLYLGYKQ